MEFMGSPYYRYNLFCKSKTILKIKVKKVIKHHILRLQKKVERCVFQYFIAHFFPAF